MTITPTLMEHGQVRATDGRPLLRCLIANRHPAAAAFIREAARLPADTPVHEALTADDLASVHGEAVVVFGNLPLHLAALCRLVVAVEFTGPPPRGREYDLEAMRAAGAQLQAYAVASATRGSDPVSVALQITEYLGDGETCPICYVTDAGQVHEGAGYPT